MAVGTLVKFDAVKGYGFVAPDDGGEDVFVHVNDLLFDKHLLAPGARLEFVEEGGDRGIKASRIQMADSPRPSTRAGQNAALPAPGGVASYDAAMIEQERAALLSAEFMNEVTEVLIEAEPSLTGTQILRVRHGLLQLAKNHGWVPGDVPERNLPATTP